MAHVVGWRGKLSLERFRRIGTLAGSEATANDEDEGPVSGGRRHYRGYLGAGQRAQACGTTSAISISPIISPVCLRRVVRWVVEACCLGLAGSRCAYNTKTTAVADRRNHWHRSLLRVQRRCRLSRHIPWSTTACRSPPRWPKLGPLISRMLYMHIPVTPPHCPCSPRVPSPCFRSIPDL